MEEKSIIEANKLDETMSQWRLKHNMFQTLRNNRQLQNRLNILQLQKQRKLKQIQNTLTSHKRFIQTKISKYQLKTAINNYTQQTNQNQTVNSRIFTELSRERKQKIKQNQEQLRMTKSRMFFEGKSMRKQNEELISQNSLQELTQKINKRNRVRLMEIGSKENVEGYWNERLGNFQESRKLIVSRRLKEHDASMRRLQKLEKSQFHILEEIKKAEMVESQLKQLIENQKAMKDSELNGLYVIKVVNSCVQ